ncbi:hypothetical protein, partial [Roseivivax sp.]
PTSPQWMIRSAHLKRCADRPLLHRRTRANLTAGLRLRVDEDWGSQQYHFIKWAELHYIFLMWLSCVGNAGSGRFLPIAICALCSAASCILRCDAMIGCGPGNRLL